MVHAAAAPSYGMPSDWDDHEGWNRYYSDYPGGDKPLLSWNDMFALSNIRQFAKSLRERGLTKIWFPGCGVSVLPGVLAAFGLRVWASDVSASAIAIQKSWPSFGEWVPEMLSENSDEEQSGSYREGELHLIRHDFRTPFCEGDFDRIYNDRAFQGLPRESMERAACVHFEALLPGGYADFTTMNVQGERRNTIERALLDAGFYVPFHRTEQWYRAALNSTGVAYRFTLRSPHADGNYRGFWREWQRKRDQKKLDAFGSEYNHRLEADQVEGESIAADRVTKIAEVFYSTG
jgi:hypothetical protein